jgi:acetyl esterase
MSDNERPGRWRSIGVDTMQLHPALRAICDAAAGGPLGGLSTMSVEQLRTITSALSARRRDDAPDIEARDLLAGTVPARLYRPEGAVDGLLVYFHGGGWTIGGLDDSDGTCRHLAGEASINILSVDYRLAPENRFPAAVEDCWAATSWAAAHPETLGLDTSRLAVAGDSSGGNLAAVVSLLARDAGAPEIRSQALVCPAVDARMGSESMTTRGAGYLLSRDDLAWFYRHYGVGRAVDAGDWRVSPLLAPSHVGLPPAVVVTAGFDPLRDEGLAYADRLENGGVPVVRLHYDDMIHGFFHMRSEVDAAAVAQRAVGRMVRQALVAERPGAVGEPSPRSPC